MVRVNKNLVLLKLLLFTFYGAVGCLMAFLTIHMRFLGMSMKDITSTNSVLPLTSLLGPPLVGLLADKLGHYRVITIVCIVLAAFLHTALLFVPACHESERTAPDLTLRCDSQGAAMVVDSCGQPCPQAVDFPVSIMVKECRYLCKDSNTTNQTLVEVEDYDLSGQPVLRLQSIKGTHKFWTFNNDQQSLEFNRTLVVPKTHKEDDNVLCYYTQEDFSIHNDQYTGLTCQAAPAQCEVVCNATELVHGTRFLQKPVCSEIKGNPKLTLWLYFGVRALAEMFIAILVSLLEAVALTMVHQYKGDFGREKMFGLLSVGIFSPLCGYLVDTQTQIFGSYSYAPVFLVFDALMIITAVVTLVLPIEVQVQRQSMLKTMLELLQTSELCILLLLMTVLGSFYGYLKTFVYVYLEDLHASKLLMGLTLSFCIFPSLPFLYRSAAVVQYCGHHYLIMLAFVSYCIRFAGLSYISNPWYSLLLETLELFTLNLMNVSAATLAYKLAPKSFVATAQALVWVSHFNIGRCIGTFVGGHLLAIYDDVRVFQGAAVLSAGIGAFYFCIYQLVKYLKGRNNVEPKPQPSRENGNVPNGHYTPLQLAEEKF